MKRVLAITAAILLFLAGVNALQNREKPRQWTLVTAAPTATRAPAPVLMDPPLPTGTPEPTAAAAETAAPAMEQETAQAEYAHVINANTGKYHEPGCKSIAEMKEKNRLYTNATDQELMDAGYKPCQRCH